MGKAGRGLIGRNQGQFQTRPSAQAAHRRPARREEGRGLAASFHHPAGEPNQSPHFGSGFGDMGLWQTGKRDPAVRGSPRLPGALRCPVEMPSVARSADILPPRRQK